jgi:hypothetical protein
MSDGALSRLEQGCDDEELIDLVVEFLRDIQAKL